MKVDYDKQMDSIPYPTCCEKARYVVTFYLNWPGTRGGVTGWFISTSRERQPSYLKMTMSYACEVSHCPFCGTDLPEIRKREDPPEPLCVLSESGDYCMTCGVGGGASICNCYPPSAAYEIVKS